MIKFMDTMEAAASTELSDVFDYKEIKPTSDVPMDEIHSFWDEVFGEEITFSAKELSDEKLWEAMFSREESDFTFDFDTQEKKLQKLLDKFDKDTWENSTEAEKIDAIENLVDCLCEALGIEKVPLVRFFEDEENVCGAFNSYSNTIDINRNTLHNPKEVVDTIAHETRHAYQYQRATIGKTDIDKLYAFNFENYISPIVIDGEFVNFLEYQDQFIEVEARAFANLFKE